jgi:lipopolysaccharide export system protein LptA
VSGARAAVSRRAALLLTAGGALAALAPTRLVGAQSVGSFDFSQSSAPIEIQASEGIEWRRDDKVYVARGNARVSRGATAVTADTLSAYYAEGSGGKTTITRVVADGHVRLTSPDQTISGDLATYDLEQGVLLMKGQALRAETKNKETLTARDSFEYWEKQLVIVARGAAEVVQQNRRVRADTLTGYLRKEPDGSTKLYQVEADGHVEIWREDAYASASRAIYNLENQVAKLVGSVKITRGQNQLNGETAEFDLNSGVSRILGGGGKPVQSLIIPSEIPSQSAP